MSSKTKWSVPELGTLHLLKTFEYYDEPVLYSCKDSKGQIFLVVFVDETKEQQEWLFSPITDEEHQLFEAELLGGNVLFKAIPQRPIYQATYYKNNTYKGKWIKETPKEWLPEV